MKRDPLAPTIIAAVIFALVLIYSFSSMAQTPSKCDSLTYRNVKGEWQYVHTRNCQGVVKRTGMVCKNKTRNLSGYCRQHDEGAKQQKKDRELYSVIRDSASGEIIMEYHTENPTYRKEKGK